MFYKISFLILSFLISSSALAVDNSSYQEEYIFLKNQLKSLQNRKAKTLSQLNSMESKLQSEVLKLGQSVSYLQSSSELLKTKLSKFDQNRSDKEVSTKKSQVVFSQMKEFVLKNKLALDVEDKSIEELNQLILSYIQKGGRPHTMTSSVYNKKGVKISGKILNFGHVASYFVQDDKITALASGNKGLDLFLTDFDLNKSSFQTAGILTEPILVSLKEGEMMKPKTFSNVVREKLKAGGAVGYIIILLGLMGIAVAWIRYSLTASYASENEVEIKEVVRHIQNGRVEDAKELLNQQKVTPLASFVDVLISSRHKDEEVYESIVVDEITKIQNKVSKYGPYLIVLAAVAPLLGLLGTVTGMIGTFDMITLYGTGNPKLLSGGIKEALVTTQMGLIVAIPCILAGNYLSSRAIKIVSKFEEVASTMPRVN